MRISVIVPTYRRPRDLDRCIEGLLAQERKPDEVLLVVRVEDSETLDYLAEKSLGQPFVTELIKGSGQVAAMNSGIEKASGDILVFLDDDAVPEKKWLGQIEIAYSKNQALGGLGGRDRVHAEGDIIPTKECVVGEITWYGRIIGNHHLGCGKAREVKHLKGANMSFRKEALANIRCDDRLKGRGAQYRNDLALSLAVRQRGWKVFYDPEILVDHYYSVRHDEDQRGVYDPIATEELAYNEMLVILAYFPICYKVVGVIWSFMGSSIAIPGVMQLFRMRAKGHKDAFCRFKDGMCGRFSAIRACLGRQISGKVV